MDGFFFLAEVVNFFFSWAMSTGNVSLWVVVFIGLLFQFRYFLFDPGPTDDFQTKI